MARFALPALAFLVAFGLGLYLLGGVQPEAGLALQKARVVFAPDAAPVAAKRGSHGAAPGGHKLLALRNLPFQPATKSFLIERLQEPNVMLRREALLQLKPYLPTLTSAERLDIFSKAGPHATHLATLSEEEIFRIFHAP
jgi:hypothetical protein